MEERRVAERRYRNMLKKSIPHIDVDKTDAFARLGFQFVKNCSASCPRLSTMFQAAAATTQLIRHKYLNSKKNERILLHKLPEIDHVETINISQTICCQSQPTSNMRRLQKLMREKESIRQREKRGKLTKKSSDSYLEELFNRRNASIVA